MVQQRQCSARTRSRQAPLTIVLAALLFLTGVVVADDTGSAPTLPPTIPPIFAPVVAPVGVPGTPMPVPEQTDIPTFGPSKQPSRVPVPDPTEVPTIKPTTVQPTTSPTRFPSRVPSPSPSIEDTPAPSVKGSESPSMNPTPSPSSLASLSPSVTETNRPSFKPSGGPTALPSLMPSNAPSVKRSGTPTLFPSFRPSTVPTIAQTVVPSGDPTPTPSFEPTISKSPSSVPTTSPSTFPSPVPSLSPSLSPQEWLVEVVMFFDDARVLAGSAEITFQRITADHIFSEFLNWADLEHPLIDLAVGTNIKDQTVVGLGDTSVRRQLQTSPLKIVFDTAVSFQSLSNDLDVEAMIGSAFNTDEDRSRYLNRLQSRGDRSFSSINTVRVEINGVPQEIVAQPSNDSGGRGGVNLFVWIGAAAGGVAILILAGLFLLRTKKASPKRQVTVASSPSKKIHEERLNTDLYMEAQDDISTLGDPMYAPGGMLIPGLEKDDTVAASIVSGDYDYAKSYGAADAAPRSRNDTLQSSVDGSSLNNSNADLSLFGGLGKMDSSIFSDDSSFEQQFADMEERFEVDAPSGKLGMVIDTPSGGVPVVHAIKETSVLADRVGVGDRLMAVDDEDTTGLTAMQVSKLISQKAENSSRILVFARTRARTESADLPQ